MAQEFICPAVQVLFYEDRAEVTRRCCLELAPGRHRLRLNGLSPVLVNSSIRLQVSSGRVSGLRVGRARVNAGEPGREDQLFQQRHQLELCRRRGETLSRQCRRSEQGIEHWVHSDLLSQPGNGQSWRSGFERQLEEHLELLAAARQHEDELVKLQHELDQLEERRQLSHKKHGSYLDFQVDTPGGELELELRYQTGCALWRPEYVVETAGRELELTACAILWQTTGEDWTSVRCLLATARPSRSEQAPPADSAQFWLRTRDPETRDRVEAYAATQSARLAREQQHVLQLAPDDRGRSMIWEIPEPISLAGDGEPARFRLATTQLKCRLERAVYPELSREVHLKAQAVHDGFGRNWPILAGPVRIEGNAQSIVPFCAPGQTFELSLGIEEELNAWRETRCESDVVPITGTQRWTHEVKVWVQNLADRPQSIWVRERIPVSELRHLKVELLEADGATGDADGFVDRKVDLEPFATCCLRLVYRILAAAEVELSDRVVPVSVAALSARVTLPPAQKAAVLLMSLPPEISAHLFQEMGPESVHRVTLEISKLPPISPEVRWAVVQEFLGSAGSATEALEELAQESTRDPAAVAGKLARRYLAA